MFDFFKVSSFPLFKFQVSFQKSVLEDCFIRAKGLSSWKFSKTGASRIFFTKRRAVSLTNSNHLYTFLFLCVWCVYVCVCVCVFRQFIPILLVFLTFCKKGLVLLNLISRYDFYKWVIFLTVKTFWIFVMYNFVSESYSFNVIEVAAVRT